MAVQIIEHAIDDPDWTAEQRVENLPRAFLTLDRCRRELRVPPGDTGQDSLIRDQVRAATSFLIDDLSIPILEEQVYTVIRHINQKTPLRLPAMLDGAVPGDPFVLRASKVKYQVNNVEFYTRGDWPLEVTIDDEDQIAPGVGDGDSIATSIIIRPPDSLWPVSAGNEYAVFYQRGIRSDWKRLDILRSLAILKLRDLFFGSPMMKGAESNSAYERLAKTVRYLGTTIQIYRIR